MKRLLIGAAFITVFICGKAQTTTLPAYNIVTDSLRLLPLPDSCWQIVADPDGQFSPEEALHAPDFLQGKSKVDYRSRIYWIRYRLTNKTSRDIILALPETASYADLYYRTTGAKWQHARTGGMVPWRQRSGLRRIPAFTLALPAGATATVCKRTYWDYVAVQPDSFTLSLATAGILIGEHYVHDENILMTSIQDAFILGLFILSMIISFYFFLVVREKEFLYFSIYLFIASLYSLPSLHDVFLREHPSFLLYLYIFSNSILAFGLIHSLRQFLKTFKWFPTWDKILIAFSFVYVAGLLFSFFASSLFQTNLSSLSHFVYNIFMVASAIIVLITLFLYIRHHDSATRLMILAFTPILCLKLIAYLIAIIYGLYYPRLGEPAVSTYATSFNKAGFLVLIVTYLWMIGLFNWVMFRRFSDIRRGFLQQKELDQVKSRFFANISHEFRTPLTLIIGPLEDLIHNGRAEKFVAMAPAMHRNAKRLLQLINQLLDLSKLNASRYHVNTSREDIIPFIRQIVQSFSSMAERKNIQMKLEVEADLTTKLDDVDTAFYFDEDIIEKIIANLLSNAIKFTGKEGSINITAGLAKNKPDFLELIVADNGPGIPEESLPHIFERFYQADTSANRLHEGSGIGLSLVKELVELHGGMIAVDSRPGHGAVFTCQLPFNNKVEADETNTDKINKGNLLSPEMEDDNGIFGEDGDIKNEPARDMPLVLIVEDNVDVRKYLSDKLQEDYALLEAENGKEGLEIATRHIPDLVISDVMMPEMDGFELCRSLKTDDRTCHIPVILLTARAEDDDKISRLETGADAYLIKPFNAQELFVRVRQLIILRNRMRSKFSDKLIIKPSEIAVTSRDRNFMQKLTEQVESHMDDARFSVEQLAEEMNMSASQTNRKLKALIDQTPQQFIRAIRMQRALDLLKNDAGDIGEIAYRVGFEDPGYFTKVFKKHFGCLPSEKEKLSALKL